MRNKQFAQVFFAKKTTVDGHKFHSKGEAKRYSELILCARAGKLSNLILQPKFDLVVLGEKITTYIGDFQYNLPNVTLPVVEDFKGGLLTPEYRIKAKLFQVLFKGQYHFVETGKSARKNRGGRKRRRAGTRA